MIDATGIFRRLRSIWRFLGLDFFGEIDENSDPVRFITLKGFFDFMTIIDRYIVYKFLFNFVLWLFCLVGIVVVFDLFTNMEDLLKAGELAGNTWKIIFTFYFFKIVVLLNMVSSLLGLLAAMITVAMMIRYNELVPIQAAGISSFRIIRPLIFSVIVVTVLISLSREILLPNYLHKITDVPKDYVRDSGNMMNATLDNETGITLRGERIYRQERRISEPKFIVSSPLAAPRVYINGSEAIYREKKAERPAGFLIKNVSDIKELQERTPLSLGDRPIVLTHREAPEWIDPQDCFVATKIPFMYMAAQNVWSRFTSTWELFQAAANPSVTINNQVRAQIHARVVLPFLDMTLLFLGLPVILVQGDRNVFKAMGTSALLVVLFLLLKEGCQQFGAINDAPVLGAWLPLMIFVPLAVNLCYGMSKS